MTQRVVKSYRVLVGLEIHVQLATESKMFSPARNGFGGPPNTQVDPIVLGLPGTLPLMNHKAVEYAMRVGLALNCQIARHTKWDRKSYYYPDLPKNYQISQYDLPLCHDGWFDIPSDDGSTRRIRVRRAHLEEDAGKLLHEAPGGFAIDGSIVDLNRAGTPLLEIVTEPDLATPKETALFGQELQKVVQFLGVSHGQMQMGHMRFEPNINLHITDEAGQVWKTAITEVKNLNSFSAVERATAYETQRQLNQWIETGSLGKKSTYGWDDARQATYWQRDKEEAHDYRYFPDPDLMPVEVDDAWLAEIKSAVGELPAARRSRYLQTPGLTPADAALLTDDRATSDLFDQTTAAGAEPKRAVALMQVVRSMNAERGDSSAAVSVSASQLAEVAKLVADNKLAASKETARAVIGEMLERGASAEKAAETLGLLQANDDAAVDAAIDALIAGKPKGFDDYLKGKDAALNSLFGAMMKSTKGLNAKAARQRLEERLKALR